MKDKWSQRDLLKKKVSNTWVKSDAEDKDQGQTKPTSSCQQPKPTKPMICVQQSKQSADTLQIRDTLQNRKTTYKDRELLRIGTPHQLNLRNRFEPLNACANNNTSFNDWLFSKVYKKIWCNRWKKWNKKAWAFILVWYHLVGWLYILLFNLTQNSLNVINVHSGVWCSWNLDLKYSSDFF